MTRHCVIGVRSGITWNRGTEGVVSADAIKGLPTFAGGLRTSVLPYLRISKVWPNGYRH